MSRQWLQVPSWMAQTVIKAAAMLDVEYIEAPGAKFHSWATDAGNDPVIQTIELDSGKMRSYAVDIDSEGV